MPRETYVVLEPEIHTDPGVVAAVDGKRVTIILGPKFLRDAKWIGVHLEVWVYNEVPDWVPDWPGQASSYGGCQFVKLTSDGALSPTDTVQPLAPNNPDSLPMAALLAIVATLGAAAGFRLDLLRLRPNR